MKKLLFLTVLILAVNIVFLKDAEPASNMYMFPKMSFNWPIRGGDFSLGFGGGIGYWIKPFMAMETSYLRFLGSGNAPDNHVFEVNMFFDKPFTKISMLFQSGSGFYYVSGSTSTGVTTLLNFGAGLGINFIPTLNLRFTTVYYLFFKHKDLITAQATLVLNF